MEGVKKLKDLPPSMVGPPKTVGGAFEMINIAKAIKLYFSKLSLTFF